MYKLKTNSIKTFDISNYLNLPLQFDKDFTICKLSSIDEISDNCIAYVNNITLETLYSLTVDSVILTNELDLSKVDVDKLSVDLIISTDPERDFYLILKEFFIENDPYKICAEAKISKKANIGINVNIDSGSIISDNVEIGNNTYIGKNVIINENVRIGNNCYLKDGSIIGSDSFKFIKEGDNYSYVPFLGQLVIQNDVWIGSNVVIEKPAIGKMIISSDVKIDDLVQIGSDCSISPHTQIAAGSIIGSRVSIGRNCDIGINTIVKPNIQIEDNVTVGMGTVVISNLKEGNTYVGNPSRKLEKIIRVKG